MSERPDPRAIAAQVTKDLKLADDILVMGEDLKHKHVRRASTGILALDAALGGGLALNQWTEVVGHESSGKTALTLKIVAYHQRIDPAWFGVWVSAEELETDYAVALGVDLDRLLVVDTNSMESAYDIITRLADEKAFDGVVIDSLPALIPTGEYEGSMEDNQMALAARLNGKFFRKMGSDGRRSLVHQDRDWFGIVINQWRSKVGVVFGDPRTTPGGVAKNYAFYGRLETRRDEFLDNGLKKKDPLFKIVGQTIVVKVNKNKSGPPQREAAFDFYFDEFENFALGDVDEVKDVFLTALSLGIIEREGNTYSFLGDVLGTNRPRALDHLENSPDVLATIRTEVANHFDRKAVRDDAPKRRPRRKP